MIDTDKVLRLPQVLEQVGLKKTALYKMIQDGEFPKQIKLGKHASGWKESEVQNWIHSRPAKEPRQVAA